MLTERKPVNRRGWKARKHNATFEYTNKYGVKILGRGYKFNHDGVELELFSSSVLADMLGREIRTIYTWEKLGFPQALYKIRENTQCNRWYSRRQLIMIRTIYEQMGGLKGSGLRKKGPQDFKKLPQFIQAVCSVFYKADIPAEKRDQ